MNNQKKSIITLHYPYSPKEFRIRKQYQSCSFICNILHINYSEKLFSISSSVLPFVSFTPFQIKTAAKMAITPYIQ